MAMTTRAVSFGSTSGLSLTVGSGSAAVGGNPDDGSMSVGVRSSAVVRDSSTSTGRSKSVNGLVCAVGTSWFRSGAIAMSLPHEEQRTHVVSGGGTTIKLWHSGQGK